MEEMVYKYVELGALGAVTLLLVTKGLNALTRISETTAELSAAQKALADSITKLTEKMSSFSFQLTDIEKRLDKLEENTARNFKELRELIVSK